MTDRRYPDGRKVPFPSEKERGIQHKVPVFLGEGPDRIEIGEVTVEQAVNGGLILDMFLTGMWTDPNIMSECLQMKGFIRAEMRKN